MLWTDLRASSSIVNNVFGTIKYFKISLYVSLLFEKKKNYYRKRFLSSLLLTKKINTRKKKELEPKTKGKRKGKATKDIFRLRQSYIMI